MSEPYKVIALSPRRKMIAARMVEAKRTIPHFRLSVDLEVDVLLRLRQELKLVNPAYPPSLNDCLIKACATALMDHPAINIQWVDGQIHRYAAADISVVVSLDDGLSTPIIRDAQAKSIEQIAREVKTLVERATKNTLKLEEILGGSFSLSNLGMFGIDEFDAIINPPQCAILAIGCAKSVLLLGKDGESLTGTILRATLSCDHRAIDGASGAKFLQTLCRVVQDPRQSLLSQS